MDRAVGPLVSNRLLHQFFQHSSQNWWPQFSALYSLSVAVSIHSAQSNVRGALVVVVVVVVAGAAGVGAAGLVDESVTAAADAGVGAGFAAAGAAAAPGAAVAAGALDGAGAADAVGAGAALRSRKHDFSRTCYHSFITSLQTQHKMSINLHQ
jgi:hypothetical protein